MEQENHRRKNKLKRQKNFNCRVCGKIFHSRNSFFPHMRAHQEMEWREIESTSLAKFDSAGSSFGLETEIRVREKEDDSPRPEHPIIDSSSVSKSEEKELCDAVNMLLTLGNEDFCPKPLNNLRAKVDESEAMSSDSLTQAILELKNPGRTGRNCKRKGISNPGFNTRKSGNFDRSYKSDNQTVDKKKKKKRSD